jgi:hypothetical protein
LHRLNRSFVPLLEIELNRARARESNKPLAR